MNAKSVAGGVFLMCWAVASRRSGKMFPTPSSQKMLGLPEAAVKRLVHRCASGYRELLREEVAQTVEGTRRDRRRAPLSLCGVECMKENVEPGRG